MSNSRNLNPQRLWIPKGVLSDKSDRNSLDLNQWLIYRLIALGVIPKDPCCASQCIYDLSEGTFPSTLTSIDINGGTITFADDVINDGASIVALLNTLGLGAFIWDSETNTIFIPQNGSLFGDLVTADDTFTNSCS